MLAAQRTAFSDLDRLLVLDLLDLSETVNDELRRLVCPLLMQLLLELHDGNLCLPSDPESLYHKMSWLRLFPTSREQFQIFYEKLFNSLHNKLFPKLIGEPENKDVPVVFSGGVDMPCNSPCPAHSVKKHFFWFQKYFRQTNLLENTIKKLLSEKSHSLPLSVLSNLQNILHQIKQPTLGLKQSEAITKSLSSRLSIISGGPGTGKTTLIVNILRAFVLHFQINRSNACATIPENSTILLCAPTGQAAQRMTEAIRNSVRQAGILDPLYPILNTLQASTLHKALSYSVAKNGFRKNENNPFVADLIIVDEVSMVDLMLMSCFFAACPPTAKIVLVGDKDQLRPVGVGAVFASIFPSEQNTDNIFSQHTTELTDNYRSVPEIRELAANFLQGFLPAERQTLFFDRIDVLSSTFQEPNNNCLWLEIPDALTLDTQSANLKLLRKWLVQDFYYKFISEKNPTGFRRLVQTLENYFLSDTNEGKNTIKKKLAEVCANQIADNPLEAVFASLNSFKILSSNQEGVLGCQELNRQMCHYFGFNHGHIVNDRAIFSGAIIIIRQNNYTLNLFNGDIGVIVKTGRQFRAFFISGKNFVHFDPELLPDFSLAFAMTIHKSQGSEFDNLLVLLPTNLNNPILNRNLLYTAVTRAKKNLVLCASRQVVKISLQSVFEQVNGISWQL